MNFPRPDDYIDIHNHGSVPEEGLFKVETLMAHEDLEPGNITGLTYSYGIHPWHLNDENHKLLLGRVIKAAGNPDVALIGEAGFDRVRGPSMELQKRVFEEQVSIAAGNDKPVVIHCVRAWDELLSSHKRLRPEIPWLVHGFHGKEDLARQLISKGMYLSLWFEFVMRPEAAPLLKSVPGNRIFLETDGADIDIKDIYIKVSKDLGVRLETLKEQILKNFVIFFSNNCY